MRTYELLCQELALAPLDYFEQRRPELPATVPADGPVTDRAQFSVSFRGHTCWLGNTLPFRFFVRLAERPNCYVSHQDLFEDVWDGQRSADAVRSVVKTLRQKLRQAGLGVLADAVDGSEPGHYALRLPR